MELLFPVLFSLSQTLAAWWSTTAPEDNQLKYNLSSLRAKINLLCEHILQCNTINMNNYTWINNDVQRMLKFFYTTSS